MDNTGQGSRDHCQLQHQGRRRTPWTGAENTRAVFISNCQWYCNTTMVDINIMWLLHWYWDNHHHHCIGANEESLTDNGKWMVWIHIGLWYNQTKIKHNEHVCIFYVVWCTCSILGCNRKDRASYFWHFEVEITPMGQCHNIVRHVGHALLRNHPW